MTETKKKEKMSEEDFKKALESITPGGPELRLNNEGESYVPNREARRTRRKKPQVRLIDYVIAPANALTKATHRLKKLKAKRKKNAKRK